MVLNRSLFIRMAFLAVWALFWGAGPAGAQEISPALQQEFADARAAIEAARKAEAEKYSPESFKKAQDLLTTADNSKAFKDPVKFAQASRLARAYAELAKTSAELKTEEEKLAIVQEDLRKAKEEIERLQRPQ